MAIWNSGTTISLHVHLSVHAKPLKSMDNKFQLEPLHLEKNLHLQLWKTKFPGRPITLIQDYEGFLLLLLLCSSPGEVLYTGSLLLIHPGLRAIPKFMSYSKKQSNSLFLICFLLSINSALSRNLMCKHSSGDTFI